MNNNLKHLDLGCGLNPKNPYNSQYLYGIDIEPLDKAKMLSNFTIKEIKARNLIFDQIPYKENFFDSVSAYDFLEHIPRIISLSTKGKNQTRYAFIELMNEIYRTLKHKGKFYALTPYYPNAQAFQDPTHVNIITNLTHIYFCEPHLMAAMYGFNGKFKLIRSIPVRPKYTFEPIKLNMRQYFRRLKDKIYQRESHLIWEFEAIKNYKKPVK